MNVMTHKLLFLAAWQSNSCILEHLVYRDLEEIVYQSFVCVCVSGGKKLVDILGLLLKQHTEE